MAFFVFAWRRDTMDDSIQIIDQLKVSHLLNWNSSSLTDSLLGTGLEVIFLAHLQSFASKNFFH